MASRKRRSHRKSNTSRTLHLESLEDRSTPATLFVTTTADGGAGSLRQAILDANAAPDSDEIRFNIPGTGVQTIQPLSVLPTITTPVNINGYTQPGAIANSLPNGSDASLRIELDGSQLSAGSGLVLYDGSEGSTIRGLVVNNFLGAGIYVLYSDGNTIAGNILGLDATGTVAKPNDIGIKVSAAANNTVGGPNPADRNVASGNKYDGINFQGTYNPSLFITTGSLIQGNYTGTSADGTTAIPNGLGGNDGYGINVSGGSGNVIADNLVSGNGDGGIVLGDWNSIVRGNRIGINVNGAPLGNTGNLFYPQFGNGIGVYGVGNVIGGILPGEANIIAYSDGAGIYVANPQSFVYPNDTSVSIRGNSIFSNGGLGIDLAPMLTGARGTTANDNLDLDVGPNGYQNFPLVATAASNPSGTTVTGTFHGAPSATFTIDFYSNQVNDNEGQNYLGSTTVTTDGGGNASFIALVSGVAPVGSFVTATATSAAGTSEFSGTTTPVTLSNVAPSNLILNTGAISENGTFVLTGSFDDPDTANTHTVTIDWGEGLPETYTLPAGARTFTFSHQYLDDSPSITPSDVYTIGVSVSDGAAAVSRTTSVIVNNVAPTNLNWNVTTPSILESGTATVTGSFADAGTRDVHTVTINWGDGAPVSYTLPAGARTFTLSHQYADDNPTGTPSDRYRVRLALADDDRGTGTTVFYGLKSTNPAGTTAVSRPPTNLYSLNSDGSGFTDHGAVHIGSTNIDVDGMAYSLTSGLLAFQVIHPTASTPAVDSQLISIDPVTASATPIGSELTGRVIHGAAFDANGRFWVIDSANNQLLELDPTTGQILGTPVALVLGGNPFDLLPQCDIAFRNDGACYLSSFRSIYTLDMQTGGVTLIFTDTALQPAPNIASAGAPTGVGMAFVGDSLFTYDAQGTEDIYAYDSSAGFTRQAVLLNFISRFNSGLGDLTNLTQNAVVTVANVNPEIDTFVATSQYGTGLVRLTGTYHDAGSQDTHTITINWGEGAPETVTVTGGTFNATHQYSNPSLNPSTTYTITAQLTDDDTGSTSKAATFLNSSFAGVAFHDVNRDGLLNGIEGPASTRTIYLDGNNNAQLDPGEEFHITDGYGNFAFNNLPAGTYHVREVPLAHWVQTTPDIEFSVGSGEALTSGRVGNFRLANISGIVFNDFNGNGVNNPGELGMPGWTVFIDANGNGTLDSGEVSQSTDAFGAYHFDDLEAGSYTIREVQQPGWTLTSANPAPITVVPNLSAQEAWAAFGNFKYAKVTGGVLFNDLNGNGSRDPGEGGIGGRTIYIDGDNDGVLDPGEATTVTDANGNWGFDNLLPGSYVIREATPTGWGSTGSPVTITVAQSGEVQVGGNLGSRINSGSLSGFVWLDANNNGEIDLNERAIPNVTIQLTDSSGCHGVTLTTTTDENGYYEFTDLLPGTYKIREIQPEGYIDGSEDLGSLGGCVSSDQFSNIQVRNGDVGVNYNFGERGVLATLHHGQTATIGFWQNKNGQNLIKSLNGGANSTALGNWLASNFSNLYGSGAGANNLAGKTNGQIAEYYKTLFAQKGQKLQAQVFAVAIAVYVTDSDTAGTIASQYGFEVNANGTGLATYNIGSNGSAFGVANNTVMSVIDILRATNIRSSNGNIYNGSSAFQNLANKVYDGINNTGDID